MKEKKKEEKLKNDNDFLDLSKEGSSELIINKNNKKIDSFEIISKEEKDSDDDYGFSELTFKVIYEEDPLFKHVISHISDYLKKNSENSDKKTIEILTNFINYDEFSEEIINNILLHGIPESLPCLRPLIWKSLIGFFPLKDLSKWGKITIQKKSDYQKIIEKYKYYPNEIKDEKHLVIINQIDKDLPRTRFDVPFFEDKNKNNEKETNYDVLRRILFFYANEHGEVSYIQGMNEIIAIIFYIFSKDDNEFCKEYSESDSYYTFEILMEQIKEIFQMDDLNYSELFLTLQIKEIKKILKKMEPDLFNYFKKIGLEIDNFVMRWILVLFAHEFKIDKAVNFWDRLFTQQDKMKFICYISVAIIKSNKKNIMEMDAEGVMEWAKQLQNKMNEIDITNIVKSALEIQHKHHKYKSNNIIIK
jgi:hypothetical protein